MALAPRLACHFLGILVLACRSSQDAAPAYEGTQPGVVWASERSLLEQLRSSREAVFGEMDFALLRLCVSRSWWAAARELVSRTHERGSLGVSDLLPSLRQEVTKLMDEVKRSADDFAAYAEAAYRGQTQGLDEVHCAVQWAQNSTAIFLGVKYAARWSAPGAIEVVDVKVNITPCCFELEGFGHHSSIRKRYVASLALYQELVPENSSWSAASVGRLTATLQKAKPGTKWPRLVKSKDKHSSKSQIGKWLDMEEKWESELRTAQRSKESVKQHKSKEEKKDGGKDKEKSSKGKSSMLKKWRRWMRRFQKLLRPKACGIIGLSFVPLLLLCARSWLSRRTADDEACRRQRAADAAQRAADAAQARVDATEEEKVSSNPNEDEAECVQDLDDSSGCPT